MSKKKKPFKPPKSKPRSTLTLFQERFVEEYLSDPRDAGAAAKRAGSKAKAPYKVANLLLKKPRIKKAIAKRRDKLGDDGKKPERVIEEQEKIAFSNIQNLLDAKGAFIPINKLDPRVAACIASVEVTELFARRGKNRETIGQVKKVKLWDKPKILDQLCRVYGMYNDKVDIPGVKEFLEAMSEIDGTTKGKLPA